jgi:RNA polymerase III subunit RPC82
VDHSKFAEIERNAELVFEVRKRFGPATAQIYEAVLSKAEEIKKRRGDEATEITVSTMEIASALPDLSFHPTFTELLDPPAGTPPALTNGNKLKRGRRIAGFSSDEDDLPQVQINGVYRDEDDLARKMTLVSEHLRELASDSDIFLRPSSSDMTEVEEWTINFLTLQQFIKRTELERIIERKYGADALRLIKLVEGKTHIDQEQVSPSTSLANLVRKNRPAEKRYSPSFTRKTRIGRNSKSPGSS